MKTPKRIRILCEPLNEVVEGESIERKMEKILEGKEKVELTRSPVYQQRRDGVQPEYNIRTNKMEILQEAVSTATQKYFEARDLRGKIRHGELNPDDSEISHGGESNPAGEN